MGRALFGRGKLITALVAAVAILGLPAAPSVADGNEAPGAPLGFRSITAGVEHSCARRADGVVRCWGDNTRGQLGLGDTEHRGDEGGELGANLPAVALGTGRTAVALSAGWLHTCAVLDDATVKCWGANGLAPSGTAFGALGQGDTEDRGDEPGEMGDALPAVDLGTGRTAVAVSAGAQHTCALLDNGSVKCWGENGNGRLGLGDTDSRGDGGGEMGDALPAVDLGTDRTAVAITAGGFHTCALLDNGRVKCWGANSSGRLGLGDTDSRGDGGGEMGDALPAVDLGPGRTAVAVSAGFSHTCAVLDNGSLKCWGQNTTGQLGLGDMAARGDGSGEMGAALPAVDLGAGRTAVAVTAGTQHTCARLDDATVKCWGRNNSGQLGLADDGDRGDGSGEMGGALPVTSMGTGRSATALTAGGDHTCALRDDASIRCWGWGSKGRLGNGHGGTQFLTGDAVRATLLPTTDLTPPANDDLADATALTLPSGTTSGTTNGATWEPGEPDHSSGSRPGGASVWFSLTAAATGTATVDTAGSSFDTLLHVYTGSTVGSLTSVASDDDSGPGTQSSVTFPTVAGTTYRVVVDGAWGLSGALTLNHSTTIDPPANDNRSGAVTLTGSGTHSQSTVAATKEGGEDDHAGEPGGASVWFLMSPAGGSTVTIDTFGSDFDTVLAVYSTLPAPSDDDDPVVDVVATDDDSGGPQSEVTFSAMAGRQYSVVVDGVGGATGDLVLNHDVGPPIPLTGVEQLALGGRSCAVLADTSAVCWGGSRWTSLPRPVVDEGGIPITGITQVAVGSGHACLVLADQTARCWGENPVGNLGDGTLVARAHPVTVQAASGSPLTGVAEVSVGDGFSCARLTSGEARCWGQNNGALGDGTRTNRRRAVTVVNSAGTGPLTGVAGIDTGSSGGCVTLGNGTVRCWGGSGQPLGDGSTTNRLRPVAVRSVSGTGPLTGVTQVSVGSRHSCARLNSGQARCWGDNHNGELGIGSVTSRFRQGPLRPVVVVGATGTSALTGVAEVSVDSHSCARLTNGQARCWGPNGGVIGDGTTISPRPRPRTVRNPTNTGALTGVTSIQAGGGFTCSRQADTGVLCWGFNSSYQLGIGIQGPRRLLPGPVWS